MSKRDGPTKEELYGAFLYMRALINDVGICYNDRNQMRADDMAALVRAGEKLAVEVGNGDGRRCGRLVGIG